MRFFFREKLNEKIRKKDWLIDWNNRIKKNEN